MVTLFPRICLSTAERAASAYPAPRLKGQSIAFALGQANIRVFTPTRSRKRFDAGILDRLIIAPEVAAQLRVLKGRGISRIDIHPVLEDEVVRVFSDISEIDKCVKVKIIEISIDAPVPAVEAASVSLTLGVERSAAEALALSAKVDRVRILSSEIEELFPTVALLDEAADIIEGESLADKEGLSRFLPLIRLSHELGAVDLLDPLFDEMVKHEKYSHHAALCREIIEISKDQPKAQAKYYFRLGNVDERLGCQDDALANYEQAAKLDRSQREYDLATRKLKRTIDAQNFDFQRAFEANYREAVLSIESSVKVMHDSISKTPDDFVNNIFVYANKHADKLSLRQNIKAGQFVNWLLSSLSSRSIEAIQKKISASTERDVLFILLIFVRNSIEQKLHEDEVADSLAHRLFLAKLEGLINSMRDNLIDLLIKNKPVSMSEMMLLSIEVIEKGYVFPARITAMQPIIEAGETASKYSWAYIKYFYTVLVVEPLRRMSQAVAGSDFEEAFDSLDQLARAFPIGSDTVKRGEVVLLCEEASHVLDDDPAYSLALLDQANKIDPNSHLVKMGYFWYFRSKELYSDAIEVLHQAIALADPTEKNRYYIAAVDVHLLRAEVSPQNAKKDYAAAKKYLDNTYAFAPHLHFISRSGVRIAFFEEDAEGIILWANRFIECYKPGNANDQAHNNSTGVFKSAVTTASILHRILKNEKYRSVWDRAEEQAKAIRELIVGQTEGQKTFHGEESSVVGYTSGLISDFEFGPAKKILEVVLAQLPDSSGSKKYARVQMANIFEEEGRLQDAKAILDDVLAHESECRVGVSKDSGELIPLLAIAYFRRGVVNRKLAEKETDPASRKRLAKMAEEDIMASTERGINDIEIYLELGMIGSIIADEIKGVEDYLKGYIKANPYNLALRIVLCRHYAMHMLNDKREAAEINLANKILKLSRRSDSQFFDVRTYAHLGEYYRLTGSENIARCLAELEKQSQYKRFMRFIGPKISQP